MEKYPEEYAATSPATQAPQTGWLDRLRRQIVRWRYREDSANGQLDIQQSAEKNRPAEGVSRHIEWIRGRSRSLGGYAGKSYLRLLFGSVCGLVLVLSAPPIGPTSTASILKPYVPESPHRAYGFVLAQSDLARSDWMQEWADLADRAILRPEPVALPFEMAAELEPVDAAAAGYRFSAESGRRVRVELLLENGAEHAELFVDLFRLDEDLPVHVTSTPAAPQFGPALRNQHIALDVPSNGDYVVRVQPSLRKRVGTYRLTISTEPQLAFPVHGHDIRSIQSGFGASRDGGAREHRGVDIFAPRGTPVVASLDARVARVETTDLGGNVVWLQPLSGRTRLYYAHLNTQNVAPGQYVFTGETIGTVGNTGNARTTPPHLHFGVYIRNRGGARDPNPFLK